MSETPLAPPPAYALEPAPGAKGAKVCGILSIVFALTCLGIPVAIVLGIVALVQQGKAKRAVQAQPGRFAPVPATGLVTGIIGLVLPVVLLPFVGIVSAIAVPALLGQREMARAKVVQSHVAMAKREARLTADALPKGPDGKVDPEAVVRVLLAKPEFQLPAAGNPYAPLECVFMAGDAPERDGQVALKGGYTQDGKNTPAIQIRVQVRKGGKSEVTTTVITLD